MDEKELHKTFLKGSKKWASMKDIYTKLYKTESSNGENLA